MGDLTYPKEFGEGAPGTTVELRLTDLDGDGSAYAPTSAIALTAASVAALAAALTATNGQVFTNAGAPVDGGTGTFAGSAIKGAVLIDTTGSKVYTNTNTLASPTWTALGVVFTNAGAPASGGSGTLFGVAEKGSILIDTTNTIAYLNTNTLASPTWTPLASPPATIAITPGATPSIAAVVPGATYTYAVGSANNAVLSLPAAASSGGQTVDLFVTGSTTKTFAFSTDASTGVADWIGGTPAYPTTVVTWFFRVKSDGVHWHGVIAGVLA